MTSYCKQFNSLVNFIFVRIKFVLHGNERASFDVILEAFGDVIYKNFQKFARVNLTEFFAICSTSFSNKQPPIYIHIISTYV